MHGDFAEDDHCFGNDCYDHDDFVVVFDDDDDENFYDDDDDDTGDEIKTGEGRCALPPAVRRPGFSFMIMITIMIMIIMIIIIIVNTKT